MPDLTIENAPEDTLKALEAIAKRTSRSVSAVALDFLPNRPPLTGEEGLAQTRTLRQGASPPPSGPDSTTLIRRDRDRVAENELTADQALELVRQLRARSPAELLPDSTPGIRADRDAR